MKVESVEAAEKLLVIYSFENKLRLTDSFKETIKKIRTGGGALGIEYRDYLDMALAPEDVSCDTQLFEMAYSLIHVHVSRFTLSDTEDDRENASELLCFLLVNNYWYEKIRRWTESPDMWFDFLDTA